VNEDFGVLRNLVLTAWMGWSLPAYAELVDRIAAVVDQEVITLSEVYAIGGEFIEHAAGGEGMEAPSRREAELEVLDELIHRALISREIEQLGLLVTADEVDRAIDDIARSNNVDRSRLRVEVEKSGLDWPTYRGELEQELQRVKFDQVVIQPRITLAEDEVRDLYNRQVREVGGASRRELQCILLPFSVSPEEEGRARLLDARARLVAGESWETVAADFPESPYANQLGALGLFEKGELHPALDGVAFALAVGEISELIHMPDSGLVLLRVLSEQRAEPPGLESMRQELQGRLMQQKMAQETELWLAQAKRRVSVEVKLEP